MVFDESGASETRTRGDRRDDGRRSTLGKYAVATAAVVAALLLFGIMGSRFGKDLKEVRSPLIGQPAPAIELELLEASGRWSLDQHRGSVVVVNFWASWCLGCRLEHDDLLAASAAYQDRGVVFIGVVFQDEPGEAIAFLDELGRGYPNVVDPGSRTAVDYGVWAIPETYFVDRDGVVRSKISGESDYGLLMSHLDAVLALDGP
ncbi:MAG: TlpA family protein disulfide reductase [Actinobacteria bacterium]|nr:TlpA family protein disulfide reductase [Actinomycetota bacterium]